MIPLIPGLQAILLFLKRFLLGRVLFAIIKLIFWIMGREPDQVWEQLYVHVVVRGEHQFWRLHWKVRRVWRRVVGVVREVRDRSRGIEPSDPSIWASDMV
ncbi:hypothetical protein BKA64DRAFT_707978 [Cadophora sp. MPI-SDFR-AT-0126]|nr:hypothetical protein BKA64DRAFT_707978 [Leotiomycetes sp. MPI-SDFR-AT-0126]